MTNVPLFHAAFPVLDLESTSRFYAALGGVIGRTNRHAVTVSLGGHQLVGHLVDQLEQQTGIYPRHFGLIFDSLAEFDKFADRVASAGIEGDRRRRFDGHPIAHWTLVLRDPAGNVLEFKQYDEPSAVFGHTNLADI